MKSFKDYLSKKPSGVAATRDREKLDWFPIQEVVREYDSSPSQENFENPRIDALVRFSGGGKSFLVKNKWHSLCEHLLYSANIYLTPQQANKSRGEKFYNIARESGPVLYKPKPLTFEILKAFLAKASSISNPIAEGFVKHCSERCIANSQKLSTEFLFECARSYRSSLSNVLEACLNDLPDARRYFLHDVISRLRLVFQYDKIEAMVHRFEATLLRSIDAKLSECPVAFCFSAMLEEELPEASKLPELTRTELLNACKVYENRDSVSDVQLLALDLYRDVFRLDFYGRAFRDGEEHCYDYWPRTDGNLFTSVKPKSAFVKLIEHSISKTSRGALLSEALDWLEEQAVILRKDQRIYLQSTHRTLESIVHSIETVFERHRESEGVPFAKSANFSDERSELRYVDMDPEQRLAFNRIHLNPLSVCSGRGGVGKTSVIEKLTQLYGQKNAMVCLTAFVGKCVSNLKQRTQAKAKTIHRYVQDYEVWKRNPKSKPEHKPSYNFRVLIIDETSLVDFELFARLLEMLVECSRLQKIVIVGDVNQLPSIGAGAILEDLCEFLGAERVCFLETNHRNASATIFENATRIRDRNPRLVWDESFVHVDPERYGHDLDRILEDVVLEYGVTREHSQCIGYRNRDEVEPVNRAWRAEMYEFHTNGQNAFSPHIFINELVYFKRNNYTWKVYNGEKLRVLEYFDTENSCPREFPHPSFEKPADWYRDGAIRIDRSVPIEYHNQELFVAGQQVYRHARLLKDSGKEICVPLDALPFTVENVSYAYCMSIHKFQGCEEDTVLYYVRSDSRHANWRHVYTAITRSKRRVIVIASKSDLSAMIRRASPKRASDLAERLTASPTIAAFMLEHYQTDTAKLRDGTEMPMADYNPFVEALEHENALDAKIFDEIEAQGLGKRKLSDDPEEKEETAKRVKSSLPLVKVQGTNDKLSEEEQPTITKRHKHVITL